MAVVAIGAARNVILGLAGRDDAIMAGAARTKDLRMVDSHNGRPQIRRVAVLADISRQDVCLAFTSRLCAVVTADTVAGDVDVIEVRRQPADRAVTIVAGVAAVDVRRVLARGDAAVVAGITAADDVRVIDRHHGLPHIRRVAVFANIAGQNMRQVLAGRIRAVMAAGAVTGDIHVIKIRR